MSVPSLRLRLWFPVRNERGATAVEYALMAALIAVVVVAAVAVLGTNIFGLFDETASSYADAT